MDFISCCNKNTYEIVIFVKVVDNGSSGCRMVVKVCERKLGYILRLIIPLLRDCGGGRPVLHNPSVLLFQTQYNQFISKMDFHKRVFKHDC